MPPNDYPFRTVHGTELAVYKQLTKLGFECVRRGWPDIAAINWETGEVRFVEVKGVSDNLKPHQKKMQKIFEAAGIDYELMRSGFSGGEFIVLWVIANQKQKAWSGYCWV